MNDNNILAVILAGGKSKRFGEDKNLAKLGSKSLIEHVIHKVREKFKKILIIANKDIKIEQSKDVKFDIFGINKVQPIWADQYFKTISNSKMGLNLSRGQPIKYYSSDRITQITGNGLVTLIDEKTGYRDFFNDKEMIFYKNLSDLSEKISKISQDEKLRKSVGKNGKEKYLKYFNSTLVAEFIINKSFDINNKNFYLWHNR